MTTSNVSTAVKIVVSMVVVAALVATRLSSTKVRRERDTDVLGMKEAADYVLAFVIRNRLTSIVTRYPFTPSPSAILPLLS
jgi:hypothetical protein